MTDSSETVLNKLVDVTESIDLLSTTAIEQSEVMIRVMSNQDALNKRLEALEAMIEDMR